TDNGATAPFWPSTVDRQLSSCRGNKLIVPLVLALELQKIVVAAHLAVRIAAAHVRPSLVDGAPTLVRVEESADRLVNVVALMAQDLLVRLFGFVAIRKALLSLLKAEPEMLGEPGDVVVAHCDAGV